MKKLNLFTLLITASLLLILVNGCDLFRSSQSGYGESTFIPSRGNSWIFLRPGSADQTVSDFNNRAWTDGGQVVRTYFRVEKKGRINIGIRASTASGTSVLRASFGGKSRELGLGSEADSVISLGTFRIPAPGYYYVDLQGISKEGQTYAAFEGLILGGEATDNGVFYANEQYFYWGRRGPSVHLRYSVPPEAGDIKWFYNEVTIPEGNDVIGSYFMANGFREGYFGMQVNSENERRILFSVWSPYKTDDPSSIPPEYRIRLNSKGDETVTRDFGNEGSGGQSFLRYMWKPGTTYGFLLKVEPAADAENCTDYTAYFHAPEKGEWMLIASWRRPFTSTWAESLYSFLENFHTTSGPLARMAYYGNQWVCNSEGQWYELSEARFTADATARDKARLDYAGGVTDNGRQFFLKNCGFFNDNTSIDISFTRQVSGQKPEIDFSILP